MNAKKREVVDLNPGVAIYDMNVANAIKVGVNQLNYLNSDAHDMHILGAVVSIRRKDWGDGSARTVYTTLNNVIFWRQK